MDSFLALMDNLDIFLSKLKKYNSLKYFLIENLHIFKKINCMILKDVFKTDQSQKTILELREIIRDKIRQTSIYRNLFTTQLLVTPFSCLYIYFLEFLKNNYQV